MRKHNLPHPDEEEELPLSKAGQLLLQECRTVLPGIQSLFGFQLIAVFNERFSELLSKEEQWLHLLAVGLVAVSVALIMSPAAYHRQTSPKKATGRFIRIATRLVFWSIPPLAIALSIEFYVISRIVLDGPLAPVLATIVFAVCVFLWFVLPRSSSLQRIMAGTD
jgi:hypothetical protein